MTSPEPSDFSQAPLPKSSSGNFWKWFGMGCAGFLVLGVGAIAALVFIMQRSLNMTFNSAQAEEMARKIVDYEIPGGSQGLMSMDGGMMQFAEVISTQDPSTMLVVGRMDEKVMQGDPAVLEKSMQDQMQQSGNTFMVEKQRTESRQFCGKSIELTILEGKQLVASTSHAVQYKAFAIHNGAGIFVSLITSGADAQAKADAIFDSLKCQ
jgi:hypothetical protein